MLDFVASFRQENQYFSSDFPSASAECQHTHDPARAVLYSGAGNRLGEVLLDRIKRPVAAGQQGSLGEAPWNIYIIVCWIGCWKE